MPGEVAAGRPTSPTVHPRTRPEGEEFAIKNRRTNDWFRHDGKNVEEPQAPPSRLMKNAEEYSTKNKGEPDEWFVHKNGQPQPKASKGAPTRVRTDEAKKNLEKIKGSEESWFKHEENKAYVSPRPKSRLTGKGAEEIKEKAKGQAKSWYKHEHGPNDSFAPSPPKHRTPTKNAADNAHRMMGTGTPDWYRYDNKKLSPDGAQHRPHSRLTNPDAEGYLEKHRHGSAQDWFGHHTTPTLQAGGSPRVSTAEGEANLRKWKGESGNWFSFDANKGYTDPSPEPRCRSNLAREMLAKSRGDEMQRVLKQQSTSPDYQPSRTGNIKPEAQEIAKKNVEGIMKKCLDQAENKDYHSARPDARVKPEAREAFEKNQGTMNNMLQGYPDTPKVKNQNRVRPEAEENASRNKGTLGNLMTNYGNLPESGRKGGRANKPEAQGYADRNRGTLATMMNDYGQLEISGRPAPRLKSEAATQNAERCRGTVGSLLHFEES